MNHQLWKAQSTCTWHSQPNYTPKRDIHFDTTPKTYTLLGKLTFPSNASALLRKVVIFSQNKILSRNLFFPENQILSQNQILCPNQIFAQNLISSQNHMLSEIQFCLKISFRLKFFYLFLFEYLRIVFDFFALSWEIWPSLNSSPVNPACRFRRFSVRFISLICRVIPQMPPRSFWHHL